MRISKNITISPVIWGGRTLKEFKKYFKGKVNEAKLETIWKSLPKPKKKPKTESPE